jgi:hypothetical protein
VFWTISSAKSSCHFLSEKIWSKINEAEAAGDEQKISDFKKSSFFLTKAEM